jgi:DNA (cytosine-5)-methyltransferase 1
MAAYYNEYDPKAAAWLRELIKQGHIADGVVDERSIEDVIPTELAGFTQCHFFAGIGVWSYALRQAGWADDRPVWTGSCPCQPFSAAGKGAGFADERHLWPAFHHLISQCQPAIVLGEQVASKDGLGWLDLVLSDLEATGYAGGAVDLCAAGVGAPHIRQRLWWVGRRLGDTINRQRKGDVLHPLWVGRDSCGAVGGVAGSNAIGDMGNTDNARSQGQRQSGNFDAPTGRQVAGRYSAEASVDGRMDNPNRAGQQAERIGSVWNGSQPEAVIRGAAIGLADTTFKHDDRRRITARGLGGEYSDSRATMRPGQTNGHWRDADWLFCRDGKWRPVEPSTSPLAHGSAQRVGRLRGYGNAIVAQAAQAFVESVM